MVPVVTVPYVGAVTESTGPYFGTAFNPAAVTRRTVGQASFQVRGDGRADFSYSVDGVQVVKVVQRYTFRKNDFSGAYLGSWAHDRQASFTIEDGADFRMRLVDQFGGKGTCDFTAPFFQSGSERAMSGTFSCAGGRSGTFTLRNAFVGANGFTATFESPAFDAFLGEGHIGGARR